MKLSTAILIALMPPTLFAEPVMLVTPAETKASMDAGEPPTSRATPQPGAPRIELVSPDVNKPVNVPTRIEVKFSGNPPGEPKPETFKALYGTFKIDITQRLLNVAKVTKDGVNVTDASLPSGKHDLLLLLTDSLGRETQQKISFSVP
jgi:hypothetical protein